MVTLKNIHPGEILAQEFLIPFQISQTKAAKDMNVSPRRINEIILGKRSITADTALRLSLYFGTSEYFWMGLQDDYELEATKKACGEEIKKKVRPFIFK